jgi:hypothetical protein
MPNVQTIRPLYKAPPSAAARARAFALAALVCVGFGGREISQRLIAEAEGTIVTSETTTGNRPVTIYRLRGPDGGEREYVAGPTDASLPRRLPVGTHITKRRFDVSWERDGKTINDFPILFYLFFVSLGLALAAAAGRAWLQRRSSITA